MHWGCTVCWQCCWLGALLTSRCWLLQCLNVKTTAFNPRVSEQTQRLSLSAAHFGAALATGAAVLLDQPYRVLEIAAALSCISGLLM